MVYRLDTTNYNTASFRSVPGIVGLGSLGELAPGDSLLKEGHMELFVRWKVPSNHQAGAYVYSFNSSGETVRNPHRVSNRGNLGFNSWSEMTTYRGIRYTLITGHAQPTPQPPARPTLRRGSNAPIVRELQTLLNRKGGYGLDVDGDFGPKTEAAVRAFQANEGIGVDGVVGPVTWGRLDS